MLYFFVLITNLNDFFTIIFYDFVVVIHLKISIAHQYLNYLIINQLINPFLYDYFKNNYLNLNLNHHYLNLIIFIILQYYYFFNL